MPKLPVLKPREVVRLALSRFASAVHTSSFDMLTDAPRLFHSTPEETSPPRSCG